MVNSLDLSLKNEAVPPSENFCVTLTTRPSRAALGFAQHCSGVIDCRDNRVGRGRGTCARIQAG